MTAKSVAPIEKLLLQLYVLPLSEQLLTLPPLKLTVAAEAPPINMDKTISHTNLHFIDHLSMSA
jgi:hypothetical protein